MNLFSLTKVLINSRVNQDGSTVIEWQHGV